jgi:hypothetical protein
VNQFPFIIQIEPLFILAGQDSSPIIGLAVTKHELIEAVVGGVCEEQNNLKL